MNTHVKLSLILALLLCSASVFAQSDGIRRWTFNVGAGPTAAVGSMHNRLNTGWNINVGGGINASSNLALVAEFGYNSASVADRALQELNVPDGNSRIYSITINPMIRLGYDHRIGGYIIGGGGWYHRTVEFTQPTTAIVPVFDPWFGFIGNTVIGANQVIGSKTNDSGGANIGAGFTIGVAEGAKFYTEVRYHWMNAGAHNTSILPITMGFRW